MRKLSILAASLTILCSLTSSKAQVPQVPTAGTTPATVIQSIDTPYGTEYIVVIDGVKYRAVQPLHIATIEQLENDLTECKRVSADQVTDIASLHREIGLLNQVADLGAKIDKLRADQLDQFGKFTLRQQVMEQKLDTSTTTPSKGRVQRFFDAWQTHVAFTLLSGAASGRTLFAPPVNGPCVH